MVPTQQERQQRDEVIERVVRRVREDVTIRLPAIGDGLGEFRGCVGAFRYLFEGEDDLLHLVVDRVDGAAISVAEAREVAAFLLPELPSALVWLKPGEFSQHFYVGHDELVRGG